MQKGEVRVFEVAQEPFTSKNVGSILTSDKWHLCEKS
jgi:hypothetical protein